MSGVLQLEERVDEEIEEKEVEQVTSRIESALHRFAEMWQIIISAEGHRILLGGAVESWSEKIAAELAARSAPGVSAVENHIEIERIAVARASA